MTSETHAGTAPRLATRLVFLVAGFGIACWAPLVPIAKAWLAVTDAMLGLLLAPVAMVALAGFVLIGLGASNVVPVLFRTAGTQTIMPPALAIGAITTTGYAGILTGPAAIGFVAELIGLRTAFWLLAALMCAVPLAARAIAPPQPSRP